MIIAFIGIIVLALAEPVDQEKLQSTQQMIGIVCVIACSWCYAGVAVATRKMQKLHFAVVLFYYSVLATVCLFVYLASEALITKNSFRFFHYSSEQYAYTFGVCVINAIALTSNTIATQCEKSGFVTMLGYLGVVYGFCGDIFIFNQQFSAQELVGAFIILSVMMFLLLSQLIFLRKTSK